MPEWDKLIGRRLAEAISDSGLLKKQVAKAMGVNAATLSRFLTGETAMEAAEVRKAAALLRKPVDWLLGVEQSALDTITVDGARHLTAERRRELERQANLLLLEQEAEARREERRAS